MPLFAGHDFSHGERTRLHCINRFVLARTLCAAGRNTPAAPRVFILTRVVHIDTRVVVAQSLSSVRAFLESLWQCGGGW